MLLHALDSRIRDADEIRSLLGQPLLARFGRPPLS